MWVESLVFSERHLVGLSGCGVWGDGFLICWGGCTCLTLTLPPPPSLLSPPGTRWI